MPEDVGRNDETGLSFKIVLVDQIGSDSMFDEVETLTKPKLPPQS